MITARLEGFDELERDFAKEPQIIDREFRLEIKSSAKAIEHEYRRNAKSHFVTGTLDASISADSADGWKTAEIGSDVLWSLFIEVGTKAHKIPLEPKPATPWAGWLHFFWAAVGVWAHAMQVDHPGTPAYNLLLKAYITEMEPFEQKFGKRLMKRLERIK